VCLSIPPIVTSLLLVFVAAQTGWLPVSGMRSLDATGRLVSDAALALLGDASGIGGLLDVAQHMIVPVLALALPLAAFLERLQARSVSDVMDRPFLRAAVARGVPASRAIWRHAWKAALTPVAAKYGIVVGTLLSGSFAVEMVTAWPGLGRLTLDALRARDLYLVAGCTACGAAFLAVGTFVSDVALALVDPRTAE
jgi:peptide/nickel transport system permease protein